MGYNFCLPIGMKKAEKFKKKVASENSFFLIKRINTRNNLTNQQQFLLKIHCLNIFFQKT